MSPSERARQIDREEFEAECAAIRQRAYARFDIKPQPEKRVREWIKRVEPKGTLHRAKGPARPRTTSFKTVLGSKARLYTAFNSTRTLKGWAEETGLSRYTIRNRLNLGWTIEQALTLTPQAGIKPGVVSDLPLLKGTGAGSTAQETPNITFSGIDA